MLVVPIAFTTDHVETLGEIDIDLRKIADRVGIEHFHRAPALNDSDLFTSALSSIVATHLRSHEVYSLQYPLRCTGCTNPQCRSVLNPIAGTSGAMKK